MKNNMVYIIICIMKTKFSLLIYKNSISGNNVLKCLLESDFLAS